MPRTVVHFSTGEAGPLPVAFAQPAGTTAALSADAEHRTLAGLAVPYGVASAPSMDGERYRFSGPPINNDDLVDVVREHNTDELLGRLSKPWTSDTAGLHASARVFATARGNDALVEASEGARSAFSIGAVIHEFATDADGVRDVQRWEADHLGVVRRPAFKETNGVTVKAAATTPERTPTMTDPTVVELPTIAELAAQVAEALREDPERAIHPLAQFATFTDYVAAFTAGDDAERERLAVAFAAADQLLTDNPGLQPPAWRTTIAMNLDARRPAVTAFGTVGLPDSGMDSSWPYLDPALDLDALIAQQAAEKTELSGVKVKVLKDSTSIKTAGVLSDISYQLLMRGTPQYLAAYTRICMAAWARYTEAKFAAQLQAKGTNAGAALALTDADTFSAQLFAASMDVEDAVGAPADTVLVDRATFRTLGGMKGLRNPAYNPAGQTGNASARTLRIDVNGLTVQAEPFLPAATMIVSHSEAAKFAESGAMVASAENVAKLGRDVAVWGMYEDGEVYYPAGVRIYKPQV